MPEVGKEGWRGEPIAPTGCGTTERPDTGELTGQCGPVLSAWAVVASAVKRLPRGADPGIHCPDYVPRRRHYRTFSQKHSLESSASVAAPPGRC